MRNGPARKELETELFFFFRQKAPIPSGERVVVAFSGGPDSLALLLGLTGFHSRLGVRLLAYHLDHSLDNDSARRAAQARDLARGLSVPFHGETVPVGAERLPRESIEAAARRVRYRRLEAIRERFDARYIVTAHHRDDQAETVVLRIAFGSGLEGLTGIRARDGHVVRPLLGLPRALLQEVIVEAGLEAVDDPTNSRLTVPRNRARHLLLPLLEHDTPELRSRLARLAAVTVGARDRISRQLTSVLEPRCESGALRVERRRVAQLPEPMSQFAWTLLHRAAGLAYPPRSRTIDELARQLDRPGRLGCDVGQGWRWEERGDWLVLRKRPPKAPDFTYNLKIPGELEISEISRRFRITRRSVSPWMTNGEKDRVGVDLPLAPGDQVTIRNRRPGDRLRPLGRVHERKLKDLLIDGRWPREERDRIPLLCLGRRIVWVPGLTIDHRYRLGPKTTLAWAVELEVP